jgi:DNA processing protein
MLLATTTITREEELHWLALRMVPSLGARRAGQLIERFRTPQAIFRASASELEAAGLLPAVARSIASGCAFEDAVVQQEKALACGAEIIPITAPHYPQPLREIFDPPVVLFARGRTELLNSLTIAIVGTRHPTPYGAAVASRMAADLGRAGLTIASGMARGIDTAAHRGAIEAGAGTVAVFGCGVDVVYPSENRKLAEEIAEKGLVVSEFPMATPAYPQNFPIRNRVVSGMSLGVLVVEGAQYSGSAITARLALDQGREVFAVPGSILSKMSWGPNLLIKQGAKLVQEFNDVIEELSPDDRRRLAEENRRRLGQASDTTPEQQQFPLGPMTDVARKLLEVLTVETPLHIDQLLERVENCSSSEIIATLFELELLGLAKQLPGRNFVKVW